MKKEGRLFLIVGLILFSSLSLGKINYAESQYEMESNATFSVTEDNTTDPEIGSLVLKQVPNFDFGTINEKIIYSGFSNRSALTDDSLVIRDTRLGSTTWSLTASMGKFTNNKVELNNVSLELQATGSLGENLSGIIKDDNFSVELAKSSGAHGLNEFSISKDNAKLSLAPNPKLNLSEERNQFKTVINWTLNPGQPKAPSA